MPWLFPPTNFIICRKQFMQFGNRHRNKCDLLSSNDRFSLNLTRLSNYQ